jgi:hypothetical protein
MNKKLTPERIEEIKQMLSECLKESNNWIYYSIHKRSGNERPNQYVSVYTVTSDKSIKNLNYLISEYLGLKRDLNKPGGYIVTGDIEMQIRNHLSFKLYGNDYQITAMDIS